MSRRPLVFVSGLTLGDYLLWNWSLNGSHDLFAEIAGVAFFPLALACLWLLARSVMGAIARRSRLSARRGRAAAHAAAAPPAPGSQATATGSPEGSQATAAADRSPGQLAA